MITPPQQTYLINTHHYSRAGGEDDAVETLKKVCYDGKFEEVELMLFQVLDCKK